MEKVAEGAQQAGAEPCGTSFRCCADREGLKSLQIRHPRPSSSKAVSIDADDFDDLDEE